MKNKKGFGDEVSVFWAEAELAGVITPQHFMRYYSVDHVCPTGKDVYLSFEGAECALKMRKKRERTKAVYRCHICGHYHLTTRDGEGRRKREFSRIRQKETLKKIRMRYSDSELLAMANEAISTKVTRPGKWTMRHRSLQLAFN